MFGIILSVIAIVLGILTGLTFNIPYSLTKYLAVAILACLDSVFGAYNSNLDEKFNLKVFVSGFFGNALIAIFLVFVGLKLDVDIYLAVIIVFSTRILNNFTFIRRKILDKTYDSSKSKKENTEDKKSI
ncbi:MAG: small basic family protein [Clostridia bacterium]